MAVFVPGRPPDGLYHGRIAAEEAFLVRIQNGNAAYLRQIQSFPEQVDAYQHIELPGPQFVNDLCPFNGSDIRVKVTYPDVVLFQVIRQVLRHPFGQGGHQYPFPLGYGLADLPHQVVDLSFNRPHFNLRVQQSGRTDDLLHYLLRFP